MHIGDFRVLEYPDSVVDDAAQVFGNVTVDIGRDGAPRFIDEDFDVRVNRARLRGRLADGKARQRKSGHAHQGGSEKFTSFAMRLIPTAKESYFGLVRSA
jgi:hypothetical protein